ncbi:YidH family protein [Arthrobacter sp. TMN-37]
MTLGKERNLLAWIRTALAFLAGAIAVKAFTSGLFPGGISRTPAVLLLVLAMMVASVAGFRWLGIDGAMRHEDPLPLAVLVPVLAAGAAVAAGIVVIFFPLYTVLALPLRWRPLRGSRFGRRPNPHVSFRLPCVLVMISAAFHYFMGEWRGRYTAVVRIFDPPVAGSGTRQIPGSVLSWNQTPGWFSEGSDGERH